MPVLTKEQQEAYNSDPSKCPFCGSTNFDGQRIQVDGNTAWQDVDCNDCGESWTDIYTFSGISHEETEEYEQELCRQRREAEQKPA